MINRITHLKKRKGFTLVECIVAVAVFAALVMVIFMILANARTEANMANQSEQDLNNLIDNVIGDDTYKIYNSSNSEILNMSYTVYDKDGKATGDKGDFSISYDTINGYKNYVECPKCKTFENNTAFMGTNSIASFGATDLKYTCPSCSHAFEQTLVCDDCLAESNNTDTNAFTYDTSTGSYYCDQCGGSSVQGKGVKQLATDSEGLSISGIVPNAIRYGVVSKPSDEKAEGFVIIEDKTTNQKIIGAKVTLSVAYTAPANHSVPGKYTFTLSGWGQDFGGVDEENARIIIYMPNAYVINNVTPAMNGLDPQCAVTVIQEDGAEVAGSLSQLVIDDIPNELSQVSFSFNLQNYKNYYSFDRDYTLEDGLVGYWFKAVGKSISVTNGAITSASGNKTYTMVETED